MKKRGLTLVELMIMVAVVACIAAIAIPNLMRQQMLQNETSAVQYLGEIVAAQQLYSSANGHYAKSLAELAMMQERDGYVFSLGGSEKAIAVSAQPKAPGRTGIKNFFADAQGIYASVGGLAGSHSEKIK
ncbi:MAG: type IV pilin-like G/H family protein [Patescibacteria group bacterium]|jgi:type II secretory pathway pseudopilin PulG|nr:type IV pilin-like G/H family protein [Patescibacteria group bacterium]